MTDVVAPAIRGGTPVLYLPDGYLKRGRADMAAMDPFDMGGVPTTRLASDWKHVPVAHLRPHPLAAEIAALEKPDVEELYFPAPPCPRCNVDTYHDGDGFTCEYCLGRWSSNGLGGVFPCVECRDREADVTGADKQPRCTLCEVQVRTGEIEPSGPYQCRGCRRDVYGIGPESNSPARINRRCGGCQQYAEHREYMDTLSAKYDAAKKADVAAVST